MKPNLYQIPIQLKHKRDEKKLLFSHQKSKKEKEKVTVGSATTTS
jgi:hypothetical protein